MDTNLSAGQEKDYREAIAAGEKALMSIEAARKQLSSASHWGLVDIFGGGFITDLVKHSKLDKAQGLMNQMGYDLKQFQKELGDIQMDLSYDIGITDTMYMFDLFFDNVFADVMVQGKINEALDNVEELQRTITKIVNDLKVRLG